MSHVFISYSHHNLNKLEKLVEKLKASDFSDDDIWYDKHMKAGDDWRDEIEVNLKEAYAIVVIVTQAAMNSTYVTYEWSWALGNGTPVVPLLFEDLPTTQIHARLSKINYRNCIHDISDEVISDIKDHNIFQPDKFYLLKLIHRLVMPIRILSRFTLWVHVYVSQGIIEQNLFDWSVNRTLFESTQLWREKLPEFMVDKSFAIPANEHKKCRNLLEKVLEFHEIMADLLPPVPPLSGTMAYFRPQLPDKVLKIDDYRLKQFEPAFDQLGYSDVVDVYRVFDKWLEHIANGEKLDTFWEQSDPNEIFKSEVSGLSQEDIDNVQAAIEKISARLLQG